MKTGVLVTFGALVVCSFAAMAGGLGACAPPAAQLQQMGTRNYPNNSPEEVHAAALVALKVQGYEVVAEQPMIRTAPKLVAASAVNRTAAAQEVAWDVEVTSGSPGAVVRLTPRVFFGGTQTSDVSAAWAGNNTSALFGEIDTALKNTRAPAPPASEATPTPPPEPAPAPSAP
jgi:hypothetical protein